MRTIILVFASVLAPVAVAAQTAADQLSQAIGFYEQLQVERARDMFMQVVSGNSPFEVSLDQRVQAYLYLGASYAILQQPDSAGRYFLAAIERDPFADLDPQKFTPQERGAFGEAKLRTFRVGLRPILDTIIDPRSDNLTLDIVTTHEGQVSVEIRSIFEQLQVPIFQGQNDGFRQIRWNGTLSDGGLIDPGSYELVVWGSSTRGGGRQDSVRVLFDIEHQLPEALEDTLAELRSDDLLGTRYGGGVAIRELAVGLGVAAGALVIPRVFGSSELDFSGPQAGVAAGAGAIAGLVAFAFRSSHPEIPENIVENLRRQTARNRENTEIMARNDARLASARLVVIPTTGVIR